MQQPIRYYISRSGDEPTLRSVRISTPPSERTRGIDTNHVNADSPSIATDQRGEVSPDHGASVKERLQEVIRRRAIVH